MQLEGLTDEQVSELIPASSILVGYRGSIAHGMHDPQPGSIDDRDIMSVYIGPVEAYLGFGRESTLEKKFGEFGIWDAVGYELLKFVQLLLKGNPTFFRCSGSTGSTFRGNIAAHVPEETIVRLNPGDYPFVTEPTVIDLTRPEVEQFSAIVRATSFKFVAQLSMEHVKSIDQAVRASTVITRKMKKMILASYG
ncbi:MAG TPA: nucleotidyltransferase domain-containing protein [Thermoanaerobaculia bacterium]|nr:nucleotidyltransferase domain-containing protein [Thermoanaerobaculia bacterium]